MSREETLLAYTHTPMGGSAPVRHVICVPCQIAWPAERAEEAVEHAAAIHGLVVPDYPPDTGCGRR